jgi:multiple sugar transport system substrate-binding protein
MPELYLPTQFSKKQITIVLVGVLVVGGLYFGITSNLRKDTAPPKVKMTIWGPLNERPAFDQMIAAYHLKRDNVEVSYEPQTPDTYYEKLVNAIAVGNAPDLVLIDNRSLPLQLDKLAPLYVGYVYPTMQQPIPFGLTEFKASFPTVAEQDLTEGTAIYSLPLFIDTLALIYNKNSFDQAGLAQVPVTWTDVQNYVPYLSKLNESGQIVRAAAAMGGTDDNVKNGIDLLSLILMQSGSEMTDEGRTRVTLAGPEGKAGFNFYLSFANAASSAYTWNNLQPYSLDSIASGRVAMLFGYRDDLLTIKKKSPFASLGVAPMPQPEGAQYAVNYAKYWGLAVPKSTTSTQGWAWDFIVQTAGDPTIMKAYTATTGRPPALRSVINEAQSDPEYGVFARQALTARSWYEPDAGRVNRIMNNAVDAVLRGRTNSSDALQQAEDQINQLLAQKFRQ